MSDLGASLFGEPDDSGDSTSSGLTSTTTPRRRPPAVHDVAQRWPIIAVFALSACGLVIALFNSATVSAWTYGILLVAGCGLLFYRRYEAISMTRRAGGSGLVTVQPIEKWAICALVVGCLANGVVLAIEISRWPIWPDLLGPLAGGAAT